MKLQILLCTLLAVFAPLVVCAQEAGPPKPDFAPMTYFVGLWNCKELKNPDSKLVGTTFSFAGATDPDGYWEILDTRNGKIHITRDAPAKRWTFIYLGNGGDYAVMTTQGWVGKTLTLKDAVSYGNGPLGEAQFTRLSDVKYRASYSLRRASGLEHYETECTRV